MAKQRNESEWKAIHRSADALEPSLRARFVRAMKQLQKETSINELALLIANKKPVVIDRNRIRELLAPVTSVTKEAFKRGAKVGAGKVNQLG